HLYLAGRFTQYRGTRAEEIARVRIDTGAIDTSFNPSGVGFSRGVTNPIVKALAFLDDDHPLIAVGDLVGGLYGATSSGRLVKVRNNGQIDTSFHVTAKVDGDVNAIAIRDRTIYIGGAFRSVASKTANRIAKISQSGALDTGFSPQSGQNGTDRTVHALAVHQDKLYAGGEFTYYRGIRSNRLA